VAEDGVDRPSQRGVKLIDEVGAAPTIGRHAQRHQAIDPERQVA
jgi:hypothetical protein